MLADLYISDNNKKKEKEKEDNSSKLNIKWCT